jgi:glycine cleavage system transcriptional repressor
MTERYLVLTAVGTDRPGIVAELTACLAERGANVADSRMAILGGEFALMALIVSPPEHEEALRRDVRELVTSLGLELILRETHSPEQHRAGHFRSYAVEVHALDHPGIVHAVTGAIRELGGNVVSLETTAYAAAITGSPLFRMELAADFPSQVTAARLRQQLEQVSEAANADVDVRPL